MTNLPPTTAIEPHIRDGWLTLWFNRPESRNALTTEVTTDMRRVLDAVHDDRSVRGITLRGRGGTFCAGGDIKAFHTVAAATDPREAVLAMSRGAGELLALLDRMPQVTVALVEGAAMAGGFGVACACDVVLCEESASFAMTEAMIGLSPAQIAPYVLRRLGHTKGRRLMLTASRFQGTEALALGFADFVGADAASLEAIEAGIRADVLKCAPGAIADIKHLIAALRDLDDAGTIEVAAHNFADRFLSSEGREGIASFVEKRRPAWSASPRTKGAG